MLFRKWVESENVCIVQITRDPEEFAESFYRFSRQNLKSFIAHNFIPLWQIGVLLLENIISSFKVKKKYAIIGQQKEKFFKMIYASNRNFVEKNMKELFQTDFIELLIEAFLSQSIRIKSDELQYKANKS
jgi:hypothetical protein